MSPPQPRFLLSRGQLAEAPVPVNRSSRQHAEVSITRAHEKVPVVEALVRSFFQFVQISFSSRQHEEVPVSCAHTEVPVVEAPVPSVVLVQLSIAEVLLHVHLSFVEASREDFLRCLRRQHIEGSSSV